MTRMIDVARRAGVAPAVVSRVMNDDPTLRIRPETRRRVLDAVAELGYRAHSAARALSTARTDALALVVPMIGSPLNQEILAGAHEAATASGYTVLLGDSLLGDDPWASVDRLLREGRVDGVAFQRSNTMSDDAVRAMLDAEVPTVAINARLPGVTGTVALDDEAGVSVAMEHLEALGHVDVGHVTGILGTDTARRRSTAFDGWLRKRGRVSRDGWVVEGGHDVGGGASGIRRLLERELELPTALFVSNVLASLGVVAVLREFGIHVPADVSVIAFHDTWVAELLDPPLTTIRMPLRELGRQGVLELLRVIDGSPRRNVTVSSPRPMLIERGSTARPRASPRPASGAV